jgi:universal stress protein A
MEIAPPRPVIGFERIVCAMDLSENRGLPLRWAAMFAASCGAKVTIAHAVPAVETIPEKYLNTDLFLDLCRQAAGIIEKTKEELGVDWPVEVRGGDPEKVVHEVAEEKEADLVIVGRGHAHGLGRLRTHAYAIIRHSPCPVISV